MDWRSWAMMRSFCDLVLIVRHAGIGQQKMVNALATFAQQLLVIVVGLKIPLNPPFTKGEAMRLRFIRGAVVSSPLFQIVSYSNEKTKRAEILKIKVLLITQFLK